ncbi:MAG: GNAT family N-acetyltransferase [Myxococcales bacterium]
MFVRPIETADAPGLSALLRQIEQFKPDEVTVAEELIEASIRDPRGTGYETLVALDEQAGQERVVGYVCFGPTPMTAATWDLYWIAVSPALQGKGLGKRLYASFADAIRARGGRQVRIETSSQEIYAATGGFYERLGFELAGKLRDFYAVGDDLLIFYRVI